MYSTREREIINQLFEFQGGSITETQLKDICRDKAEQHFAVCKLRGLNIRLSHEYRTLAYGDQAIDRFRHRKDIERELTLQRRQERQHKALLRHS